MRNTPATEELGGKGPEEIALERGSEVARLYEGVWDKLPTVARKQLVDSNVVLTVGGAKPRTFLNVDIPSDNEIGNLDAGLNTLNERLEQQNAGVLFLPLGEPRQAAPDGRIQEVLVMSLTGLERKSRESRIPGVTPFDSSQGFEGFFKWQKELHHALEAAQQRGDLPEGLDLDMVETGLLYGYPDIAIIDAAQQSAEGHSRNFDSVRIPNARIYDEAEPTYDVYPEHADHPTILANQRELGALLEGFYESDFHKRVSQQPEIAERKRKVVANTPPSPEPPLTPPNSLEEAFERWSKKQRKQ